MGLVGLTPEQRARRLAELLEKHKDSGVVVVGPKRLPTKKPEPAQEPDRGRPYALTVSRPDSSFRTSYGVHRLSWTKADTLRALAGTVAFLVAFWLLPFVFPDWLSIIGAGFAAWGVLHAFSGPK